ncbi:MAG: hypothetical protein B7Z72_06190 [Gemmatimonadetes bacterium 21-71-4]|nr:MAG: hypothetical protein B7Z72_06190 [Gemmatimonadetes bacterium 21-71-4]
MVVCTPHLMASRAVEAPYNKHLQILGALRDAAPAGLDLRLGWEIMLDMPGTDLRHPQLALGGSKAVLVEFPRMLVPPHATEELFRLKMSGIVPVLAHPERYSGCTVEQVEAWRRSGTVIQVDGAGLLGGHRSAGLARALLEEGLIDVIASDTHGDARSLAPVRDWLLEVGTGEQAELLTHENARRLLADEPLEPAPPLVVRHGMMAQLRRLLLGRTRSGGAAPS